jgi:hypothetical protein
MVCDVTGLEKVAIKVANALTAGRIIKLQTVASAVVNVQSGR